MLDFYNTLEMKPFLFVTKSLWLPGILLMTLENPIQTFIHSTNIHSAPTNC